MKRFLLTALLTSAVSVTGFAAHAQSSYGGSGSTDQSQTDTSGASSMGAGTGTGEGSTATSDTSSGTSSMSQTTDTGSTAPTTGDTAADTTQSQSSTTTTAAMSPEQLPAETVQKIQQALNDEGHSPGSVDGVWGPQTAQALQEFQRDNGLPVTGSLDTSTLSQLNIDVSGIAGSQSGSSGSMSGSSSSTMDSDSGASSSQ